jgi:transcriptional regulator with XRE-family HTH domain
MAFLESSLLWLCRRDLCCLIYTSYMTNHEELGTTIRKARLDKNMSLGQLASAVGRSSSSVRRWERGEVAPAASVLPKLAAILEIDADLLDDSAPATSSKPEGVSEGSVSDDGRVSTMEQPVTTSSGHSEPVSQVASEVPSSSGRRSLGGAWASLTRGDVGWMGWARGFLTVAVLLVMLLVMIWAAGELLDALGGVLDSFDVGSGGG